MQMAVPFAIASMSDMQTSQLVALVADVAANQQPPQQQGDELRFVDIRAG